MRLARMLLRGRRMKTLMLALAVSLSFSATACTTQGSPDDDLVFDSDTAKADVSRPTGVFRRELGPDDDGFRLIRLNEDRTYKASQELVRCDDDCTDTFGGTYRFASSHGKRYVVLFNDGDIWYSFEYKLDGGKLQLRDVGTDDWFAMNQAADVALTADDNGGTFDVPEGSDVVLQLASNGSTGYNWKVTETDRTFGYPTEDFEVTGIVPGSAGGGGTLTLTWPTFGGPLSYVGEHHVKLEYRRDWESSSTPAADTYELTVNVTP
jgi:predicted secreted protein